MYQIVKLNTILENVNRGFLLNPYLSNDSCHIIKSVLTDEFQTADAITSQIDGEDVTRAKVIARLGQLVKNGEAEKTDVKTDDNRTVKAYKLAE